jgi:hypothetical protein
MPLPVKDLGPCQVLWNSIDLGPTLGGVTFKEDLKYVAIHEDGHGETPVDAIFTGRILTVEAKFTRSSLTQLEAMIESSTKTATNLKVTNSVGNDMFADSEELILKPLVDNAASATSTEWLHIFRTYPVAKTTLAYDNKGQRVVDVTFVCFPDDTSGATDGLMWRMGPA